MGKPVGAIEKLYAEHECDGISVWIDTTINDKCAEEISIGYKKILFFGELTLKGISTQVCVR
ncbi:MAG TPA: hypothetical protein PKG60_06345 [Spirochaetota bacterium]|nr:hypothetical protein [Spirochaetota bacterium]HPS85581.1 hypothetical protein [Spirochaetota bacterium]